MNFNEKINKVNDILDGHGEDAVQKYNTGSFEAIGYKPQYVIDAMNEALGIGNWRHIVHSSTTYEVNTKKGDTRQVVVAEVSIQFIENGNVVYETGKQYGGGNVVAGNMADGFKSAVTDAIGKTLSLMSVGKKAYRGMLSQYKDKAQRVVHPQEGGVVKEVEIDEEVGNMSKGRFTKRNSTSFKKGNGFKKPENSNGGNGADKSEPIATAPQVKEEKKVEETPETTDFKAETKESTTADTQQTFESDKPQTSFNKSKFAEYFDEGKTQ